MIIVDDFHPTHIEEVDLDRDREFSEITRALRYLAKEQCIPVLAMNERAMFP